MTNRASQSHTPARAVFQKSLEFQTGPSHVFAKKIGMLRRGVSGFQPRAQQNRRINDNTTKNRIFHFGRRYRCVYREYVLVSGSKR